MLAGILYYANYDRPKYTVTEDTGTEYETARVRKVIEDNTGVDASNENIVRGSMKIQVEILSGRYKGDIATTTNYFGAVNNVIVGVGDKLTVRIDYTGSDRWKTGI